MTSAAEPAGEIADPPLARRHSDSGRDAVPWRTLVLSWVVARLVVVTVLVVEPLLIASRRRDSLWEWDGYWYRFIADHGYDRAPAGGIRFFPAYALMGRWLGAVFGSPGIALLVIANAAAFAYALLAYRLARAVGMSSDAARVVVWVVACTPAAFVFVMAYTEPLFGVLVTIVLLGSLRRRWLLVAAAGLVAGMCRPTGVVLALPVLLEVWAARGVTRTPAQWARASVAVFAPVAGLFAFLGWSQGHLGDALKPLRTQAQPGLRGGVAVSPVHTLSVELSRYVHGRFDHVEFLVRLVWVALAVVLLVRSARRLPVSFTAFAAVTLALALTARQFSSFERYAASALPLLLVAGESIAGWTARRRRVRAGVVGVAVAVMAAYALAAFGNEYVP